jgi:hypothetical protein
MPIKKLTFTFEVPITQLLGLIATGNSGLKIDVLGDDRPHKAKAPLNGQVPLIEGPKRKPGGGGKRGKVPSSTRVLLAMIETPDHTITNKTAGAMLESHGMAGKSVSPIFTVFRRKKYVTRAQPGVFRLTAAGLREAQKIAAVMKAEEQGDA